MHDLVSKMTAKQLAAFIKKPSHGLLLSGVSGSGKKFLAQYIAAQLLSSPPDKLENHAYFYRISKEDGKSEISIDSARQLIKKLSLKVISDNSGQINRVAVIENAGLLSIEAQNAILKLLEEPPAGSLMILTSASATTLLPTVLSRVQKINILPVSLEESLSFLGPRYPHKDIEAAWQLSNGAAGLMTALLNDADTHSLKKAVDQAKQFLRLNSYQRLIFMQSLAKDKVQLRSFLDALSKILKVLHESTINQNRAANSAKLLTARKIINETISSTDLNTNPRLLALAVAVDMPL